MNSEKSKYLSDIKELSAPIYIMKMTTDQLRVEEFKCDLNNDKSLTAKIEELHLENNSSKIMELRIFAQNGELKWFRTSFGDKIKYRKQIDSSDATPDQYWDVEQYLDIDTKQSGKKNPEGTVTVYATGGGSYTLPEMNNYNDLKIKIRNYLDYGQDGSLYVKDWRIVGFVEEKKYSNKEGK